MQTPRLSTRLSILLAASLVAGHVAAERVPAVPPAHIESRPLRDGQPLSRAEGDETLRNAVAAVVIGALGERFSGGPVAVKLDTVDVEASSIRDRVVSGEGRMQVDGDPEWVGFRYRTLYDTFEGSAAYPRLVLGSAPDAARRIDNDAALLASLDTAVAGRLALEFEGQSVLLRLDDVTTAEAGTRFLRLDGRGVATFAGEGGTPARVDALYDRREGRWRHVDYELGPSAAVGEPGAEASAVAN